MSALAALEPLLAQNPADAELLGLKALALALGGKEEEAIASANLAVANAATPVQRLKHAGNLAGLLARAGRKEDIAQLSQLSLPPASSLRDEEAGILASLCGPLLLAGAFAFVASYLEPAVDRRDAQWELERIWLTAAAGAGLHAEILARHEMPDYRWRDKPEAIGIACAAAEVLGQGAVADRLRAAFVVAAPPYVASPQPTQIMTVVMISPDPPPSSLWAAPASQHFISNFPSQLARRRPNRYRFVSVFAGSPPRALTSTIDARMPAVTYNNCVNGEALRGGELDRVMRHEEALALPVINSAEGAVRCSRVETAQLLRGIPDLIVPKAIRFRIEAGLLPSLRKAICEMFRLPVILRTVGEQEARNLHLATTVEEIDTALAAFLQSGERDFYAIEFHAVPHDGGLYRRIRAAYVAGVPTLMRVDYDAQWMVKGRKYSRILEHYRRDPGLLALADSFIREPERIGEKALAVLGEVGRRMPLDIFGLDFEVDHEGRVVFFESNATMNLLSTALPGCDYPRESEEALHALTEAFLRKRAGVSLH